MRRLFVIVLISWLLVVATSAADAPKNASTTPAPSSTAASTTPKPKEKEKPSPLEDVAKAILDKPLGCVEAFKDITEGVETFFENLLKDLI